MESPPKRVTRARAAAKKDDTGIKTTKIATAALKAKVSRATAATTKRKTRADDEEIDDINQYDELAGDVIEPETTVAAKSTRGRPKRAAAMEQEDQDMAEAPVQPARATRGRAARAESEQTEDVPATAKSTRGRPKKTIEVSAPEPVKATRGRPKKIEVPEEESTVDEGTRKTRGRAATLTKPTTQKKTVKFEEPDKENITPIAAKGKEKAAEVGSGLRAKPVRKPAPVGRSTRGRPKAEEKKDGSSPLSPKKVTQVGALPMEVVSEDELAVAEKTPMKPLMKSPVKPPGSIFNTAKKLDFSSNSISVHRVTTQDLNGSVMASPARRPPQSPFKESMRTSPQRTAFQGSMMQSPFRPNLPAPKATSQTPSFKASLLQSPARRPASPTKVNEAGSPSRTNNSSLFGVTTKATPFKVSRFATPRTLNISKSVSRDERMMPPPSAPPKFITGNTKAPTQDETATTDIEPQLQFSGRLSSIMPRSADPVLSGARSAPVDPQHDAEQNTMPIEPMEAEADQVDTIVVEDPIETATTTPPVSPPRHSTGSIEFRERDESPFDDTSDSEDELASDSLKYSPIPMSAFKVSSLDFASSPIEFQGIRTPQPTKSLKLSSAAVRSEKREKIGFTPLAIQLGNWMSASPEKPEIALEEPLSPTPPSQIANSGAVVEQSPCKNTFFDDEMSVRDEAAVAPVVESIESAIEQAFGPVELDEVDVGLADEADEMSLLEPEQLTTYDVEDMFDVMELESLEPSGFDAEELKLVDAEITQDAPSTENAYVEQVVEGTEAPIFEQALSEASQEYGDENAVPVDPALLESHVTPAVVPSYSTPKRILTERTFHTVSKVPLKPAAEDSPMRPSPMKRSASISKLPVQRPSSTLTRKNTVISYSPIKSTPKQRSPQKANEPELSPSKTDWSNIGTPARTPRRDIDGTVLKGAVVFVDVHTTEGADASVLFTELLTQMGARCVKSWNWNGNGDDGSKIGITHVVFKDGGKRTLEKVRETDGVVLCVGVGWVLDCERENQWLSESPYAVDTALVPRGGHRRRKSMEPRALANMNGTIVSSTPSRSTSLNMTPAKESLTMASGTPMTSKSRRRDSVQWVRSPASSSPQSAEDMDYVLSPVPATPAPDMISAYGEEGLMGETPGGQTPYFLHKEHLVQKTAPVNRFVEHDEEREVTGLGWLSEKKDESVMMRLMAARRKSLQWAPKVGSPLAKGEGWKGIM